MKHLLLPIEGRRQFIKNATGFAGTLPLMKDREPSVGW